MSPLLHLALALLRAEPRAFAQGLGLGVLVLAMGAALLGLSGWFVTAAAAAGVAGIGIGFDFFRPSAGVRFLALGRAAARYGERMATHAATLRALSALRGTLYAGITRLPHEAQARLRSAEALNRLTADVDALDGLMLRLVLPALGAVLVQLGACAFLWWLVTPAVALAVLGAYLLGGGLVLALSARAALAPASRAEAAAQAMRAGALDLMRLRTDLAVAGALERQIGQVLAARQQEAQARLGRERAERRGDAGLALVTGLAGALALALGGGAAEAGTLSPARAAIGFFVALALGETLALLRRGLAEYGRMAGAAARVQALSTTPPRPAPAAAPTATAPTATATLCPPITAPVPDPTAPHLEAVALSHRRVGAARNSFGPLDLRLCAGETLLLSGPSGSGKTTLLTTLAGVLAPTSGSVRLLGAALETWPEAALRRHLTLVPQRAALMAGTVAEALALALPEGQPANAAELWAALEAVQLADALRAREGLATRLGPGGAGLSGGQAKRLVLARAALRRPDVLLLDEPTEGLDGATAAAMLAGLRGFLPQAGLVVVSHRPPDAAFADRHLSL